MKARDQRHKVLIRASLRSDGPVGDACIRDISSTGLLLQAAIAPPRGSYVEVLANGHTIVGRVIWAKDRRFGVSVHGKLNVRRFVGERSCAGPAVSLAATAPRRFSPSSRPSAGLAKESGDRFGFVIVLFFLGLLIAAAAKTTYETLSRPLDEALNHMQPR